MRVVRHSGRDACYESMLEVLMRRAFGFSFTPFFNLAGWPDTYESFSIVEEGKMLSNVCAYQMILRIHGRDTAVRQLGAVATLPERRGEGLSATLMRHVMERFSDTPLLLFANEHVTGFYPRFGFVRVQECVFEVRLAPNGAAAAPTQFACDDRKVAVMLDRNICLSGHFDVAGAQYVRLFNLTTGFQNDLYMSSDGGLLVAARRCGELLLVAGVVSPSPCNLQDVVSILPLRGVTRIRFGFCPDCLGVPLDNADVAEADSLL
ncbi:MAG: GNAT family N-acetyltransferase, partial [Clostridia bacterium]|nr:GNAT family N-acetyltransferase [Clostridia bacterium]